jgi:hypothetical protein
MPYSLFSVLRINLVVEVVDCGEPFISVATYLQEDLVQATVYILLVQVRSHNKKSSRSSAAQK